MACGQGFIMAFQQQRQRDKCRSRVKGDRHITSLPRALLQVCEDAEAVGFRVDRMMYDGENATFGPLIL